MAELHSSLTAFLAPRLTSPRPANTCAPSPAEFLRHLKSFTFTRLLFHWFYYAFLTFIFNSFIFLKREKIYSKQSDNDILFLGFDIVGLVGR